MTATEALPLLADESSDHLDHFPDYIDAQGFSVFIQAHIKDFSRYVLGLSANHDDAQDILSESLLKAYLSWPRMSAMDHPLGYMRRIIVNTLISERRKWYNQNISPGLTECVPELPSQDYFWKFGQLDELHRILNALPKRQTAMIVMRYYLNFTDEEIAVELGCTPVTVRSTISRALAVVRSARGRIGD